MKEGGDGWWRRWGLQTKLMSWHSLKETCHPLLSWCFFALRQTEQVILFTKNKIQIEFLNSILLRGTPQINSVRVRVIISCL